MDPQEQVQPLRGSGVCCWRTQNLENYRLFNTTKVDEKLHPYVNQWTNDEVREGFARPSAMPSYKGRLSDKQIAGVIEYLKTLGFATLNHRLNNKPNEQLVPQHHEDIGAVDMSHESNGYPPGDNYLNRTKGFLSWITTLDHKRIGMMYLGSVLFFLLIGGAFAIALRTELLTPKDVCRCLSNMMRREIQPASPRNFSLKKIPTTSYSRCMGRSWSFSWSFPVSRLRWVTLFCPSCWGPKMWHSPD